MSNEKVISITDEDFIEDTTQSPDKKTIADISKILYAAMATCSLACIMLVASFVYSRDNSFDAKERDKILHEQIVSIAEAQGANTAHIAELRANQSHISSDVDKITQAVESLYQIERERILRSRSN